MTDHTDSRSEYSVGSPVTTISDDAEEARAGQESDAAKMQCIVGSIELPSKPDSSSPRNRRYQKDKAAETFTGVSTSSPAQNNIEGNRTLVSKLKLLGSFTQLGVGFLRLVMWAVIFVLSILWKLVLWAGTHHARGLLKTCFIGGLIYWAPSEYLGFKNKLSEAPGAVKDLTIQLYCTFIGWKCPDPLKIPRVIGGMIQDVGNARDVFELIAELGSTGALTRESNHVEYVFCNFFLLTE